jgi:adenosylcobinamide kinase/adenosylcobinamide-phosphate guanylyltransferase
MAVNHWGKVLFVATAEAKDEEMRLRIATHKKSRPASWATLEAPLNVGERLKENIGNTQTVVIDCITMLVSNVILQEDSPASEEERVLTEINELVKAMDQSSATFILVTNEVGLGLVPDNALGRIYRESLGRANQILARHADEVYLLITGIPLRLK